MVAAPNGTFCEGHLSGEHRAVPHAHQDRLLMLRSPVSPWSSFPAWMPFSGRSLRYKLWFFFPKKAFPCCADVFDIHSTSPSALRFQSTDPAWSPSCPYKAHLLSLLSPSSSSKTTPIKGLAMLLESRLDVVLFRASFCSSIPMARQWKPTHAAVLLVMIRVGRSPWGGEGQGDLKARLLSHPSWCRSILTCSNACLKPI